MGRAIGNEFPTRERVDGAEGGRSGWSTRRGSGMRTEARAESPRRAGAPLVGVRFARGGAPAEAEPRRGRHAEGLSESPMPFRCRVRFSKRTDSTSGDSAFGFSPRDSPAPALLSRGQRGILHRAALTMAGDCRWRGAERDARRVLAGCAWRFPRQGRTPAAIALAEGLAGSPISFRLRVRFSKPTDYAAGRFGLRVPPAPPPGAGTAFLADGGASYPVAALRMGDEGGGRGADRAARRHRSRRQFPRGTRVPGGDRHTALRSPSADLPSGVPSGLSIGSEGSCSGAGRTGGRRNGVEFSRRAGWPTERSRFARRVPPPRGAVPALEGGTPAGGRLAEVRSRARISRRGRDRGSGVG